MDDLLTMDEAAAMGHMLIQDDAWACSCCGWIGPEGRTGRAGNGPPICPQCLIAGEQVRLIRTPPAREGHADG